MAQAALMPATPPPTTITDFSVPAGKWIPLTPVARASLLREAINKTLGSVGGNA